jgi:plastocyanin
MQRFSFAAPTALFVLGAAACGSSTGPGEEADFTINMTTALFFVPDDITIDAGMTVRWVSAASIAHTITPDTPAQPGVWSAVNTNQSGTVLVHTFTVPGQTYSYTCQVHVTTGMTGVIRVRP